MTDIEAPAVFNPMFFSKKQAIKTKQIDCNQFINKLRSRERKNTIVKREKKMHKESK